MVGLFVAKSAFAGMRGRMDQWQMEMEDLGLEGVGGRWLGEEGVEGKGGGHR